MKKFITVLLSALLVLSLSACSSGGNQVKDEAEWKAMFAPEKLKNVSVTISLGEDMTISYKRDGDKLYYAYDYGEAKYENYVEEKDGVLTFYYVEEDEVYAETDDIGMSLEEFFMSQTGLEEFRDEYFSDMTFDKESGSYIGDEEGFKYSMTVSKGRLAKVVLGLDDDPVTITFTYGDAKVTIPEATYIEDVDPYELATGEVSEEEWNAAFEDSAYKNVTVDIATSDESLDVECTLKVASKGFSVEYSDSDGTYTSELYLRNGDGSYRHTDSDGTDETLDKDAVESVFVDGCAGRFTFGIPQDMSEYDYDDEYMCYFWASDDFAAVVAFSNGKIAQIVAMDDSSSKMAVFSDYGTTVIED